ncbi:M15 family metallopeptidase [Sulfurovum sp.]|uniref:M15 family metallopeptidase n=1 Tax=Sulfurovum sp. TaxID=1969726 RepID=UPI002867F96D|nr:M15 family metallopeptidase [Sulfurovum sp.]
MVKIITTILILSVGVMAQSDSSISPVADEIKQRMIKGNSWRKGCPVSLKNLRYLHIKHLNFQGKTVMGEMIVHKDVSSQVVDIFNELYEIGYPVQKMKLVSDYKGNDWQSIESGNTSAFNCRNATGSKKWSKHSYGKAIDINPIENPYISRSGRISHKASLVYRKRVHQKSTYADKAVLVKGDKAIQIFKSHGWKWGGDWSGVKDYQHFSK